MDKSKTSGVQCGSENNTISRVYSKDSCNFTFNLCSNKGYFEVLIMKGVDFWKGSFLLADLLQQRMWEFLRTEDNLFKFLSSAIEKKRFSADLKEEPVIRFEWIIGFNTTLELRLHKHILGVPTNLDDLGKFLKDLEERIELRFGQLDQKIENRNYKELVAENEKLKKQLSIEKYGQKISFEFISSTNVELSNSNKTAKKLNSTAWVGVRGNKLLDPKSKNRYHYSIKLINSKVNNIMVGFASNYAGNNGAVYYTNAAFVFYLNDGNVYNSGSPLKKLTLPKFKTGDVLDVIIDFDKSLILLYKDEVDLGFCPITIPNDHLYTPCIDIHDVGDTVELN